MRDFEDQIQDARERGIRNRLVMDLASNHCSHMEFYQGPGWGIGMVEQLTGLPIGMRSVQCKHVAAGTTFATVNFESMAIDFFDEHCKGCPLQDPNGQLPTLGALVEEKAAKTREVAERRTKLEREIHARWASRAGRRRAMRLDGSAAVISFSRDLDELDPEPGRNDIDRSPARLRVEAVAARAPELFTDAVVNFLFDMVIDVPSARTLEPLRLLSRLRPSIRRRVLESALARLLVTHDKDAGRCLIELRDVLDAGDVSDEIGRSIVLLSGAPVQGEIGHLEPDGNAEIEPLKIVADIAPGVIFAALDSMLPGLKPTSSLDLPFGTSVSDDDEGFSELRRKVERAAAAKTVQELLPTHGALAIRAFPLLLRNLRLAGDMYDDYPSGAVTEAAARIVCTQLERIKDVIEAGDRGNDDYRHALFGIFESIAEILGPFQGRTAPADPKWAADVILSTVLPHVLALLNARWGSTVAAASGRLLESLTSEHKRWAADNIDAVFGVLIRAHEGNQQPDAPSTLFIPGARGPVPNPLAGIEAMSDRQLRHLARASVKRAVVNAAGGKPIKIARVLVATLAKERADSINRDVVWDVLAMLGETAIEHGQEPGLLNVILPTLRGYLVDTEPAFRAVALNAWIDIASRQPVPDTLNDLLPAFLEDRSVGLIKSLLHGALELQWSEPERQSLLQWAFDLAQNPDTKVDDFRGEALSAALWLSRSDSSQHGAIELAVLALSMKLPDMPFHSFFQRRRWQKRTGVSAEFGTVAWRFYLIERQLGLRDDDDDDVRQLMAIGPGLLGIETTDITDLALVWTVDRHWRAMTLAEILWRARGWSEAHSLFEQMLFRIPNEVRHSRLRARIQLLFDWDGPDGQPIPIPTTETELQFLSAEDAAADPLYRAYLLRLDIRQALDQAEPSPDEAIVTSVDRVRLRSLAQQLRAEASRDTDTAAYLRGVSDLLVVVDHAFARRLAQLDAHIDQAEAHSVAIAERLALLRVGVESRWVELDPLRVRLLSTIDTIERVGPRTPTVIRDLVAALPVPPLFVRSDREWSAIRAEDVDLTTVPPASAPVAVVLFDIDGKLITGPQALRPRQVYRLNLRVRIEEWPDWAHTLEGEFVTDLTANEITLPAFRWSRPSALGGDLGTELTQDGTLICRFSKGPGAPAPRFRLDLRWRGLDGGMEVIERVDVAAHREIQLRPFDSSADALTQNGPFDARLIEVFDQLRAADTDEVQVQAFARLLSAIARASLQIAWSKPYKSGASITERKFHDDLYEQLLLDPELERRLERGAASGLGYNDIRHDGITAELKVERQVPETRERSAKYISQVSQYATADGTRVSILCVLDITRKQAVVAPPENYLWVLQPPLHALPDPRFPPAVAVHVINAWSPSPSSWSRRRAPIISE
ncbi:hypothetical protein E3T26_09285 [Cryobacterium sp. TMT1-21]|uniref:hypothetical protein n=1 Tax=Cryobacterium sp. TMT1-21 TaxID=1259234 RepID=UPI00106DC5AB|nr:hypothetical protein [Cryobacterium sp. TMT1-21]TFD13791.1 hypothetical protein E3T26_09285 [Cryobacterium sp. TMT1-21]